MVQAPSRTAARILRVLPRERITRLMGRITEAEVPAALLRPVLALYSRAYDVNLQEAVIPPEGFRTFNDFFTRRLRDGARAFNTDPHTIISPADGRLEDHGAIDTAANFLIKGQRYDADTLLGSRAEAEQYKGGRYAIVYLSPRDYHRVHSPVEGRVVKVRHIPGTLYPVNAIGVAHVPQLFARNERIVVYIETEAFGTVAVVFVGAFVVGKITLAFDAPPRPPHGGAVAERTYAPASAPRVARGGDLGAFLLGSTVVVLLPRPTTGHWSIQGFDDPAPVQVGQPVARWSEA